MSADRDGTPCLPLGPARPLVRWSEVPRGGEDRWARTAWSRLWEPGDRAVHRALTSHGAYEALRRVEAGLDPALARYQTRLAELDVARDLAIGAKFAARVVVPEDEEWPAGLDELGVVPPCLWVRGPLHLAESLESSVSVVGTRASSAYGQLVASELGAALARRGLTVVSGAAFGIDACAHRGALSVEGRTIAVLAGGVERPYPRAHDQLLAHIARHGAIVSEVAPGSAPTRLRFLERNRLIAAMTQGTIVVEAALRSGSLNTAHRAIDLGRQVGCVPGPVTSATSAGCHQMIREGATLVSDADDVIELVSRMGENLAPVRRGARRAEDAVEPRDLAVFDALPLGAGAGLDRLTVVAALGIPQVQASLARLELAGLARRDALGWRRAANPAANRAANPAAGPASGRASAGATPP